MCSKHSILTCQLAKKKPSNLPILEPSQENRSSKILDVKMWCKEPIFFKKFMVLQVLLQFSLVLFISSSELPIWKRLKNCSKYNN